MLAIMIRLLILIAIVWLVRRFLAAAFGSKSGRQEEKPQAQSSNMVKDPVCGMYMDSRLALRLDGKKEERYFCSEECKRKYLSGSADVKGAGSAASA